VAGRPERLCGQSGHRGKRRATGWQATRGPRAACLSGGDLSSESAFRVHPRPGGHDRRARAARGCRAARCPRPIRWVDRRRLTFRRPGASAIPFARELLRDTCSPHAALS
jgi:hypothetical protein